LIKQNTEEADAVLEIVKRYTAEGKAWRVITPYDAQRNRIEKLLKKEKVPWKDKCFNVDSFQGADTSASLMAGWSN
jgi:superfamily I DNA and/or RNA helicase